MEKLMDGRIVWFVDGWIDGRRMVWLMEELMDERMIV
jgi:hypothetical protein